MCHTLFKVYWDKNTGTLRHCGCVKTCQHRAWSAGSRISTVGSAQCLIFVFSCLPQHVEMAGEAENTLRNTKGGKGYRVCSLKSRGHICQIDQAGGCSAWSALNVKHAHGQTGRKSPTYCAGASNPKSTSPDFERLCQLNQINCKVTDQSDFLL